MSWILIFINTDMSWMFINTDRFWMSIRVDRIPKSITWICLGWYLFPLIDFGCLFVLIEFHNLSTEYILDIISTDRFWIFISPNFINANRTLISINWICLKYYQLNMSWILSLRIEHRILSTRIDFRYLSVEIRLSFLSTRIDFGYLSVEIRLSFLSTWIDWIFISPHRTWNFINANRTQILSALI
jgi:hypothetical protein